MNLTKKLLALVVAFYCSFALYSKQVDVNKAKSVALNFIKKTTTLNTTTKANFTLNYVLTETSSVNNKTVNTFYIFNFSTGGFIIVAADDMVIPILGYSSESTFDKNNIPASVNSYFETLNKGISEIIKDNSVSIETTSQWDYYLNYNSTKAPSSFQVMGANVGPYLTTKWNQSGGYKKFCPSYTGCVATAFSQILKYYNYPANGMGYNSYGNDYYGSQAANFGATTYKWIDMPNQLTASSPVNQIDAVATLMYHAGVSINMNYGPNGSSAYSYKVVDALKNTFGYSSTTKIVSRSSYTLQAWTNLIKAELDAQRVVMHSGYDPVVNAGHAFVVDGYDSLGLYHVNWGWGGSYDGYFQLSNLNPKNYTWNQSQQLIVGIAPVSSPAYSLALNTSLSTPSTITNGNTVTVTTSIKNTGNGAAIGSFMTAIFNDQNQLVTTIQTLSNKTINAGATLSLSFTKYGYSSLPGSYKIGVYFAKQGISTSWQLVNQGNYTNPKTVTVKSSSPLQISSVFTCLPSTTFFNNDSIKVSVKVKNSSSTTNFSGNIKAGLYSASGTLMKDIQIKTGIVLSAGSSATYEFKINSTNLSGGSYYIALQSKTSSASSYLFIDKATGYNATQLVIIKKAGAKSALFNVENETDNTSIEEEETIISVYPNPVQNELNINTNNTNTKTITMMDFNGRIVKQIVQTQETITNIPVYDLANGIYIISVLEGDKQKTFKIVKQ